MKLTAQIILLILLFVNFLSSLYVDINGRKAKAPKGFEGVISTLIAIAISFAVYYFAGALNLIF